jgi:drug/metabolite transporter (DMT)-like permease
VDHRRRGLLLAAGATALLSTDGVLVRAAHADAFDVMFWTGLLSAASSLTFAGLGDHTSPIARLRRSGRPGVVAGLLQGATVVGFVLGVSHTSVANTMVIIAAAPAVTALLAWLVLRERATTRVWAAIAVSLVAVAVIVSGSVGGGTVGGDLAAVGATIAYSLLTVVLRRHPATDRAAVVGIGGLVMAAVAAGPADVLDHSARTWVVFVAMGVVIGPLSRTMIAAAPRYLPATEVALFAPVETVLAIVWAFVFYDESPPVRTWVGGAAIVATVLWATVPTRPRRVTLAG